jgi:hypothetical protein
MNIEQGTAMKPEYRLILVECLRRMREHAATPRPAAWLLWSNDRYDEETEHGPRYGCGEWFGVTADHERMRLRRAIDDLERGGLLVTWRRWGRRLSHIRLTNQGEVIAQPLAAEEDAAGVVRPTGERGQSLAMIAGDSR